MKAGDYVRTNKGIEKITLLEWYPTINDYKKYMKTDRGEYEDLVDFANIIKSSPNIIDLIEVGDYVDRLRVVDKEEDYIVVETFDERIIINKKDTIKSIVTKEQFESMEYKIGEINV